MRFLAKGLSIAAVVVWFFVALVVSAKPAYAYVDPGSGLLVAQVIGSTFLGFSFLIRKRIRQVFGLFARNSKNAQD